MMTNFQDGRHLYNENVGGFINIVLNALEY